MTSYIVHDATGRILRSGSCPADQVALQAGDGETARAAHGRDDTHWVDAGEVVERPATGLPADHSLPADTEWTVPDVPAGTVVLVDGAEAGTTDASGLVLEFPTARIWRVDLRPPFPWRRATCRVEVT